MSKYADQLSTIAAQTQKLEAKKTKLVEKRKDEIGVLAEKFGLLTLSDSMIVGLFAEVQNAIQENPEKLKSWESHGTQFIKTKRNAQATQASAG